MRAWTARSRRALCAPRVRLARPLAIVPPVSRYLVTGCAGFIGSTLVDTLLAEGCEVVGVDAFTDYYPRDSQGGRGRGGTLAIRPSS